MRDVLLFLLILLAMLLMACSIGKPDQGAKIDPAITQKVPPSTALDDKVNAAVSAKAEALKGGSRVSVLEAERDELRARFDRASDEQDQYKRQLDTNNKAIRQERLDVAQARAYWIAGISTLLGGIALAASFFVSVPILRRVIFWAAMTFGALAVLAIIFAWLVPYLVPVVCVMGALAVAGVVWQWRTDHRGLSQLVEAVEPIKRQVHGANEDLRKALSSDVKCRVDGIRTRLGLKRVDCGDSGHG